MSCDERYKDSLPVRLHLANGIFGQFIQYLLEITHNIIPLPKPRITGTFVKFGRFVWIHDKSYVSQVYYAGFFGKGELSRSEPTWYKRNKENNKQALEEITVERRRKRKHKKNKQVDDNNENYLTSSELLNIAMDRDVESFQLDLYEAFFLAYALNALSIENSDKMSMSIQDCWLAFNECNESFHVNYTVYHYYRSLGWTPKNGSKFGVDFVLYQSGPSFRHSDYAIVVVPLYANKIEETKNWDWLLRLNRICTQVKKTLVLCYVTIPADVSCANLNDYSIRQVIYKRWSPQKNREAL
ncbi:MAG: tRNA intron endonuclease [Benjaminiella poitrasii]|nr:MAG: tRNA intron endonuclease [Benjaminiella poitrasii]